MFRLSIDLRHAPIVFDFHDSVNAALVRAFVAADVPEHRVTGATAAPWTWAHEGRSSPGGRTKAFRLLVSTPDEMLASALARFPLSEAVWTSCNGDTVDLRRGCARAEQRGPSGEDVLTVHFASPYVLMCKKEGREKTRFANAITEVDLSAAVSAGLSRRAGRPVTLEVAADRMAALVDGKPRLVVTRRMPNGKRIIIPGFTVPLTLKGTPDDVAFAYYAGIGAKTTGGFGCPILPV